MQVTSLDPHIKASDLRPERLSASTQVTEPEKVAEVSRQFEAVLLRQILRDAQKPVVQSSLVKDSAANGIYRDIVTDKLADSISKSGTFGLAKSLNSQLSRQMGSGLVRLPGTAKSIGHIPLKSPPLMAGSSKPERHLSPQHGAELLRAPRAAHPTPQPLSPRFARRHD